MATSLGQIIRERRMDLGLTQEELAERIGVTVRQSDVSRLERNKIGLPHRGRLEQIAAALELSLGELLVASGWAGAIGLAEEGSTPALAAAQGADAPTPVRTAPAHLNDAIERAELLILRSELAIAMSQDTASRVNEALQRRNRHTAPENAVVTG
jgi:transcriptional regulator with XRE-family HTH domain